jgi:hypothetical protein
VPEWRSAPRRADYAEQYVLCVCCRSSLASSCCVWYPWLIFSSPTQCNPRSESADLGIADFKAATQTLVLFAPYRLAVPAPQARSVPFTLKVAAQAVAVSYFSTRAFQVTPPEVSFSPRAIWRFIAPSPVELPRFLAESASFWLVGEISRVLLVRCSFL